MQFPYLFILAAFITTSCNSNNATTATTAETAAAEQQPGGNNHTQPAENKTNNSEWQKLVPYAFKDAQGQVAAVMPFPADWKVMPGSGNGAPSITGPRGLKVTDYPAQSFMYVHDPNMQQMYYQSGQRLRAMPGIEQLIQQDLVPWANNRGLQFVKHYEIPEVSKIDKWYSDQLYKAVPTRSDMVAIGTEWKDANGNPFFLLLHINVSNTAEMQNWYYMANSVEAEPGYFEQARKQYIFSLANTHYPLEPIMAYNEREAQKAGISWAAHNQRMAQNQANFEASQRAHVNRTNAINDAIMSGWRERNAASDRQQEQFIDVITERTNVIDPSTGQKYKVSSGYNHYWMNSNGEYISTNQFSYNPNQDDNLNGVKWQELNEVK